MEKLVAGFGLHAWVVMLDHVHVILQPRIELPALMRWLEGRTSRIANRLSGGERERISGKTSRLIIGSDPEKNSWNGSTCRT